MTMLSLGALDQTATVYTENPSTGMYTVVARSGLACRLVHIGTGAAPGSAERAELAALRNMLFEPDYVMPEQCQVEVDNTRWQPVVGTFAAIRDWISEVQYRKCDVVRQG